MRMFGFEKHKIFGSIGSTIGFASGLLGLSPGSLIIYSLAFITSMVLLEIYWDYSELKWREKQILEGKWYE